MRKPRGGQIRANRLIGPRKVLGEGDRRVPAKGRGRTAPYRGRSAASWIWSTPLDASASEGELRSGYALTPSPSHSRNNLSLERAVSEDGYSSFFLILVWGFPIVAAGILFDVDQSFNHPHQVRWQQGTSLQMERVPIRGAIQRPAEQMVLSKARYGGRHRKGEWGPGGHRLRRQ